MRKIGQRWGSKGWNTPYRYMNVLASDPLATGWGRDWGNHGAVNYPGEFAEYYVKTRDHSGMKEASANYLLDDGSVHLRRPMVEGDFNVGVGNITSITPAEFGRENK